MKKTRVKVKFTAIMDQIFMRRKIIFIHTTTMPLMNRMTVRMMELLKIFNGYLSQIIYKFLVYHIVIMGPMG